MSYARHDSESTHERKLETDPTQEEIRAACEAIQAEWSDEEREYRIRCMPSETRAVHQPKRTKFTRTCDCGRKFKTHKGTRCKVCRQQLIAARNRARRAARKAVAQ